MTPLKDLGSYNRLHYLKDILDVTAAGLAAGTTQEVARILGRPPRTLDAYIAENASYWRGEESSTPQAAAG